VGARQVRSTRRAGSAGGSWWGGVCLYTISVHPRILTDCSKSQLAIQYAHSIRDVSPHMFVFWVHASTRARFEEAYRDIAHQLQLPGRSDPKVNVLRLVSDWLRVEINGRWLMVVDNVDNVETFFPSRKRRPSEADASSQTSLATYLPQSRNGAVLITSRSKDAAAKLAGGYNKIKEVFAMDENEGLQLLRNKLRDPPNEDGAVELLHALDHIPLAITQAAAYINQRARMTVARYLDEFQKNDRKRENLLNWDAGELRRDDSASNSVVTTWQMLFEQIQRERSSAVELLSLMSFFNPQGIPESTLRRHSREAAGVPGLEDNDEVDSTFEEDLDVLQAYSLVSTTVNSEVCEMHALVQFCTQLWLSSFGSVELWKQRFVVLMAQELPSGEYENWGKCQQLLPHVAPLFDAEPATKEGLKAWAQVLNNASWYLWERGSYSIAQETAAKALTTRERALGVDDRETLSSVDMLAQVLQYQGKYEEAEKLYRRKLEGYKKLREEPSNRLTTMSKLARVLGSQGKFEEAETLNRRALEGLQEMLGGCHRGTLSCMGNLALVLRAQGKYVEAEKLSQRALEGREKELGIQHPHTLTGVSNLASVLRQQGKYDKAEKLSRQALEGREKELGIQHPDTLTSVSNLASVLQHQGKYNEAEKLSRRALEGDKKELGMQHPYMLASASHLASVLQHQGKYNEAEKLSRQALEGMEKELGIQHPRTLTSVSNLASVLRHQGKYDEAETLKRRALEGMEKELGIQHPHTLISVSNLASVLRHQGKYDEAEKLSRRALEGIEKELGIQHPHTLTIATNLASVLRHQGKYDEAEKLSRQALEGREKELGIQHPHTLTSVSNLASVLRHQGKYNEAEKLSRQALEGREKELGIQHPDTLTSVSNLASVLRHQGKYNEAEKLSRRALEGTHVR
jgi:tetratricopeptide (TPR) repeat protein